MRGKFAKKTTAAQVVGTLNVVASMPNGNMSAFMLLKLLALCSVYENECYYLL